MPLDAVALALAFAAGGLSTLSPCVLPLLPAILMGAVTEHRFGPVALSAGLALSFATAALFFATVGYGLGLSGDVFRAIVGALMLALGLVLIVPAAQTRWALAAGPLQSWTDQRFGGGMRRGLGGQFGLGMLLGAVWIPCVGPTLGAASLMASRGENLASVGVTVVVFALGAATPLLLLGMVSRSAWMRWSKRVARGTSFGKTALGVTLAAVGLAVLTGADRVIETYLVSVSPLWLTELTTRF